MTTTEPTDTCDVLKALYGTFAAGDVPAVLAAFDPGIVWTEAAGGPYAGTYTGPDAVLQNVLIRLGEEWDGFGLEPDAFVCSGERGVVVGSYHGRYRATGRTLEARFAHVWSLRGGRPTRFEQITDTVGWHDATG